MVPGKELTLPCRLQRGRYFPPTFTANIHQDAALAAAFPHHGSLSTKQHPLPKDQPDSDAQFATRGNTTA